MAQCWDDKLNDQLVSECESGSPTCSPKNVAQLLSLPYCSGSCQSSASTLAWSVGIAGVLVGIIAIWRASSSQKRR